LGIEEGISTRQMINQYEVNLEKAIKDSLSFIRNDAGFKIPKLLNVLQSI